MSKIIIMSMLFALLGLSMNSVAGNKDSDAYIKVEIKGTLMTGVVAIGGETTGTTITVNNVTWELDLDNNKEFQELAKKLHKKTALVAGTYQKIKGVEIPERHIVKVTSLKSAE